MQFFCFHATETWISRVGTSAFSLFPDPIQDFNFLTDRYIEGMSHECSKWNGIWYRACCLWTNTSVDSNSCVNRCIPKMYFS